MNVVDVSVIIVNYKTPLLVINAIESIFSYTKSISLEIFVVDNASGDDSKNILTNHFGDKICYIGLQENIGFGRGNNAAISIASGKYVFLLNSDALLMNNAIEILYNYLDSNLHVGACGCNLYNEDGSSQPSFTLFYNSIRSYVNRIFGYKFGDAKTVFNYTQKPMKVSVIFGAAMMIRKSVLGKVGAFNPNFFMYAEEEELCYRIHKAGYLLMNIPTARIKHLDGRSSQFVERRELMRREGLRTYFKLTHSSFYFSIIKILDKIFILSRYLKCYLSKDEEKLKYWKFYLDNPL